MRLMTLNAVAAALDVSTSTVRREIACGQLTVVRIRDTVKVDAKDLEAYIERSKVTRDLKSLGLAAVPVRPRLRVQQNQGFGSEATMLWVAVVCRIVQV